MDVTDVKAKIKELLSRYTLTIALGCVIANLVINRYYYEQQTFYTVVFAIAAVGLFLLFDQLRKHRFLGPVIYIAMLAGAVYLYGYFTGKGWRSSYIIPTDWFYLDRANSGFVYEYFLALLIFGGFFMISILYYFTQVRFRSLGLMLCLLFPFVIYAKRADVMPPFKITLIITLFLAIVVHHRQQQNIAEGIKAVHDLPYYLSVALFVSFAGAVCMLIPDPEVKSVLERDSHAFDLQNTDTGDNQSSYTGFSRQSSPRYGASYTNEILFYATTDYNDFAYYLKRQAYDTFENEQWTTSYNSEKFSDTSYYQKVNIDRDTYYDDMRAVALSGAGSEYGIEPGDFDSSELELMTFNVYSDDFDAIYVPNPAGTIAHDYDQARQDGYYTYGNGETSVTDQDADYDYVLEFYPETVETLQKAAALRLTGDDYYKILRKAQRLGVPESEDLIYQYEKALENYTGDVQYSDRMKELAYEITKDCTSDYQKAVALVNYFEENNYVYDLEYVPEDTSIDYFLFDSKTGSCTSYATSMTLMARIIGLPARYVEGFVAYERNGDSSELVIRDAHAHAYVEVFIPGAGWLTFDPTVEGYMVDRSTSGGFNISQLVNYFSRVVIFLAVVLFIVFIVMLDRIIEIIFRIRLRFTKGGRRITMLYLRTIRHLAGSTETDLSAYTAQMAADFAMERKGIDITPITTLFEKTTFGLIPLDDEEFAAAYASYKLCCKQLRKKKKPGRAAQVPEPQL